MAITNQQRDEILKIVAGLFNGAPGGAYLSDFAAAVEAGMSMQDLARTLAATSEFKSGIMGGKVTVEQQVAVLMNHFGVVADDVEGSAASQAHAFFTDSINAGVDLGDIVYTAVMFLENDTSEEFAPYKALLNNKALVAALHSENVVNIASVAEGQSIFGGVTSDGPSTTEEATDYLNNLLPGSTFTLTAGADNIVGTDKNDVINANESTITALDTIDGKGGNNDNLIISDTTGTANLSLLSVSNVENLNLVSAAGLNGDAADVSGWTGLTNANFTLQAAAAAQTVTAGDSTAVNLNTKGNGALTVNGGSTVNVVTTGTGNITVAGGDGTTSATTSGGTNISINGDALTEVTVNDAAGTVTVSGDALTTVTTSGGTTIDITGAALTEATISGNIGTATVTGDAVATVNLADTTENLTIVNTTKDHAITVNLEDVSTTEIADGEAKTATVNYTGADSDATELAFTKATSLTIGGDAAVTGLVLQAANQAADLAITVTNSAGVEIDDALNTDVTFTGGAGADSVKIGATTKAIAMGDGDDMVTLSAGPGTGGTIDGGAGDNDTLKMTATLADTLDADTDFNGKVSGFEHLHLTGATNQTLDFSNLDGISSIIAEGLGNTLTIDNLASGGSFEYRDKSTATVINVKDAATGTADVLNVRLSSDGDLAAGTLTAADVETINIEIIDTDDGTVNADTLELVASKVATIKVTGNAGLTLTNTSTTVTSFDASGVTEGAVTWATGALAAAATITGSAGDDDLDASAATKAVTLDGGAGDDTLSGSSTVGSTINGDDGDDTITGGAGADTINGGDGDDVIAGGAGLDQLTGGAGNDTFVAVANTNGNIFASILDAEAGDAIEFADHGTETFATTAVTLGSTAVFQDYLNEAAKGDGSTNGAISWFQFGGNTYVVEDKSAGSSYVNNADIVIELVGTHDLSTATLNDNVLTLA